MLKILRNIAITLILLSISYLAIARFTNFLPQNWNLLKGTIVLTETPVLIEEIKEINQLVSAEFYGEVYADLFMAYNDLIEESGADLDKISSKYRYLKEYAQGRNDLLTIKSEIIKLKNEMDSLRRWVKIADSLQKVYKSDLDSLEKILKDLPKGKRESDTRERFEYVKNEIDIAEKNYKTNNDDFEKYSKKLKKADNELSDLEKKQNKENENLTDFINNHNLVYIGRGHISAGFLMQNVNFNDIDTSESKKIIVNLPKAQIIDTVINPWYIKTQTDSVAGFEIYINKKDRHYTNDDVMLVKQKCRKNLASSALDKGILDMASKNGLSTLESFFMLLGFDEVQLKEKEPIKLVNNE